ncbi:MAG: glycosyltransferase family 4 protein [Candidatus Heimdallarchaeota archaeon]
MIKIFEHAVFVTPKKLSSYIGDPINRNRTLIALRLPPEKFHFLAYSREKKFASHISLLTMNKTWPLRLYRFKPDIIHTKLNPSCLRSLRVARLANKKVKHVTSVHGMPETWRIEPKHVKAIEKLIAAADVVHSVSQTTAREIEEKWGLPSFVIYNGVDTNLFSPRKEPNDPENLRVLYVGRLVSHKHPEIVVQLAKDFPDLKFTMIGQGEMHQEIADQIQRLSNITLTSVSYGEMPRIYRDHDIFLFPSVHEGLSNAILEAIASGLPILARNATSMAEIIRDGHNGYLCEDFEAFEERLRDLIGNINELQHMSSNARSTALKFDWDEIVNEYETFFESLVL